MKALLVPALILLSSVLAFGQIVVFPNRVSTVEKLPRDLKAYYDAVVRLGGLSAKPCQGGAPEQGWKEIEKRARKALVLELEMRLNPDDFDSPPVKIHVLNKYPFLSDPPGLSRLTTTIKKAFNVWEKRELRWFAWGGKAFVFIDPACEAQGGLRLRAGDGLFSRLLAWSAWVKGKPDLCFEQGRRSWVMEPGEEGDYRALCGGHDVEVPLNIETPILVSPEGLIFACADCSKIDSSEQTGGWIFDLFLLAPCGSPFSKVAAQAMVYPPDPEMNGVVIRFRNPVRGSRLWFLPAWGGKLQPLKTYKPKLPTSR